MKKILTILLSFIFILSFSQRQSRKLGYGDIDSLKYNDGTQTEAYKSSNLTDSLNNRLSDYMDSIETVDSIRLIVSDSISGITVDLTAVDSIIFTKQAELGWEEGKFYYDTNEYGLVVYNEFSDISGNIMFELWQVVRNTSGSTIPNGTPIRSNGWATGQIINVTLSSCSTKDSAKVLAVTTMEIANNAIGIASIEGEVRGLNTSAYSEGDQLYLCVGGSLSDTLPLYPNYGYDIGVVTYSHTNHGRILLNLDRVYENHRTKSVLYVNGNREFASDSGAFEYHPNEDSLDVTNIGAEKINVDTLIINADTITELNNYQITNGDTISTKYYSDSITRTDVIFNNSLITNSSVISEITNYNNWVDGDFVDPSNILDLITAGQEYWDNSSNLTYKYDGTNLYRYEINYLD